MAPQIEEQLQRAAIDFLHDWKKDPKQRTLKWNERIYELFKIIQKSDSLRNRISLQDIGETIGWVCTYLNKILEHISDEEFTEYLKSTILATKTYHFYYPIYNVYRFPKNMKLGHSIVLTFEDLPKEVQQDFILTWKHHFTVNTEYARTEGELVDRKKACTYLHLVVMANGHYKATERASSLAQDSVHILRFLYAVHFPVNECRYTIEGSKNRGGMESVGERFPGSASYVEKFGKMISELTDIITKSKPTTIERKIKNTVRIFGIQTSITSLEVRFVLLVTCLESLLLTESDRDYILWKLAEKTAFLIGKNRKTINDFVKSAYKKRSAFIHEKTKKKKEEIITETDVFNMESVVFSVFRKLMEFRERGYAEIQKKPNFQSIDEHIEEIKFGKE